MSSSPVSKQFLDSILYDFINTHHSLLHHLPLTISLAHVTKYRHLSLSNCVVCFTLVQELPEDKETIMNIELEIVNASVPSNASFSPWLVSHLLSTKLKEEPG